MEATASIYPLHADPTSLFHCLVSNDWFANLVVFGVDSDSTLSLRCKISVLEAVFSDVTGNERDRRYVAKATKIQQRMSHFNGFKYGETLRKREFPNVGLDEFSMLRRKKIFVLGTEPNHVNKRQ